MSIADKITSITGHLEDDYTALETLGVSVEDRNIENIKDMANQIYAKFPKTSYAEGSNITLSNTLKGKLDFEDGIVGYGDTKQESTNGYNVLKLVATTIKSSNTQGTWNNNTYTLYGITFSLDVNSNDVVEKITISGTSTQQATFYLYNNSNYLASGSYLLSGCSNGSNTTYDLRSYNTNNTGEVKQNFTTPISVTSNGGTQAINFALVVRSSQTISNAIIYPMLESGTTAHDWEQYTGGQASPNPSYPQDIEVVRGTQTVYIKDENNNIIDTKTINLGEYEFAKIGNYVDTIEYDVDEDKVYKNEKIGNKTFIGSNNEGWNIDTQYSRFTTNTALTDYDVPNRTSALCTHYRYNGTPYFALSGSNHYLFFGFPNENVNTLVSWLNWLSQNTPKVYYILTTSRKIPITTILADQIKALYNSRSFTGTTIIEIDGQLPLIIKVRALKGE